MKKRTGIIVVVATAGLVWLAVGMANDGDEAGTPPNSVRLKLRMPGADRTVDVSRQGDGSYAFTLREPGRDVALSPDAFAEHMLSEHRQRVWWHAMLNISSPVGVAWVALGLLGQVLFTGRMVVQWLVSEKHRRSVVPVSFWWMSLGGATMLLTYFIWRQDIVGVLGQATGWFIYVRNLYFIYRRGQAHSEVKQTPEPDVGSA
jgi:lipid-A-disaccharide synthase-like uncharacterized protein